MAAAPPPGRPGPGPAQGPASRCATRRSPRRSASRRARVVVGLGLLPALAALPACGGGGGAAGPPGREPAPTRAAAPPTTLGGGPLRLGVPVPARRFTRTGDRAGFAHGWELLRALDDAAANRELDRMRDSGARWLRVTIEWGQIEREPGRLDWAAPDRIVAGARRRGLSVVGSITYAPPWAAAGRCRYECAPADAAAYARFAGLVVRRYRPVGVRVWEIWNEPNHPPFWPPRGDPAEYTQLLRRTYPVIKAADPGALVLAGGFAPSPDSGDYIRPQTFLAGMYAAGAKGFFDGLAHHPYYYFGRPTDGSDPNNPFLETLTLHDIMVANGDGGKPIWGTEVGAPTNGPHAVSEQEQAVRLREYYEAWNAWAFTGPLLWYSLRDSGMAGSDGFGLLHHDFFPKPAWHAFTSMIRAAPPAPPAPDTPGGQRPSG